MSPDEPATSSHLLGGSGRAKQRRISVGVSAVEFQDKTVIVAGGGGELGRAVSLAFFEAGATVMVTYDRKEDFDHLAAATGVEGGAKIELTYRQQKEFESLATATGAAWARLAGMPVEVTDEADAKRFVDSFHALHGRIDVLVNTVGGYAGSTPGEADEHRIALNLRAGLVLARAVLPAMIRQNRGWIVNVALRAATALALFDSLAEDVKGCNINVNSVVPSLREARPSHEALSGAAVARWPGPEEIAKVVLFLCSEGAGGIHGAAVPVYGHS